MPTPLPTPFISPEWPRPSPEMSPPEALARAGKIEEGLATLDHSLALIGIGGHLAAPPLPHHRAYGFVPRWFDRVERGQEHRGGGGRGRRNTGCAGPVGRPDVRTCARNRSASRQQPPRGILAGHAVAVLGSGWGRFAIAARGTLVAFGGSMPPGGSALVGSGRSQSIRATREGMARDPRSLAAGCSLVSGGSCPGSAP